MYTPKEAKDVFSRCRDKSRGAVLTGRSTLLVKTSYGLAYPDGCYGIKYHNTIVVDMELKGGKELYRINTGGWYSNTTRDRINTYSPISIVSVQGTWFCANKRGRVFKYQPDIVFDSAGNCKTKGVKSFTRKEFYGKHTPREYLNGKLIKRAKCIFRGEVQRIESEASKKRREFKKTRAAAQPVIESKPVLNTKFSLLQGGAL